VKQAKRDLERTDLKAPFAGRIVEQMVDVGQFVSQNTELGRAFATDIMEVRLPLTNRYLSFVELPSPAATAGPDVLITGKIGRASEQWQGRVVRVDSSIDEASRQLFVVAEIKDPYHLRSGEASPLLKIGMFVDALVKGQELQNVFVLPRKAVRVGGEVIVIDSENKIERRQVDPIWSEDEKVIIAAGEGGLNAGEVVCLTPLAYPANGAPVLPTIDGITPEVEQPPGGPGMGYGKKGTKRKDGKGRKGEGKSSKEPQRS
jgi:RND family efflux transporter MFP subunit